MPVFDGACMNALDTKLCAALILRGWLVSTSGRSDTYDEGHTVGLDSKVAAVIWYSILDRRTDCLFVTEPLGEYIHLRLYQHTVGRQKFGVHSSKSLEDRRVQLSSRARGIGTETRAVSKRGLRET